MRYNKKEIVVGTFEELDLKIVLPDGQIVQVYYDYPEDYPELSVPELAVHLPQELCVNCWCKDKSKPSIVAEDRNEIVIPILPKAKENDRGIPDNV